MSKSHILLLFLIITNPENLFADKLIQKNKKTFFNFGQLDCTQYEQVISENSPPKSSASFECRRQKKIVFKLAKFAEVVFVSPDSLYLLGVSNVGPYSSAFWVIDSVGNIVAEKDHLNSKSHDKELPYCNLTISLERKWADLNNPDVSFEEKNGKLTEIQINGCNKQRFKLSEFATFRKVKTRKD